MHALPCKYTPQPKLHGYIDEVRQQAIRMYVDGMNLRRIGRNPGLHHRTVSLWVKAYVAKLPPAPKPEAVKAADADELFTFIDHKKNRIYILTLVDQQTHCFLGWKVVWERTQQDLQAIVDEAPKAKHYYSDAFDAYDPPWVSWGCL